MAAMAPPLSLTSARSGARYPRPSPSLFLSASVSPSRSPRTTCQCSRDEGPAPALLKTKTERRSFFRSFFFGAWSVAMAGRKGADIARAEGELVEMEALKGKDYGKTKMRYSDYTLTESGLQYQDIKTGSGPSPKQGQQAVVDWAGYTIGYYGRIFEARNKPKGSSFTGDDKGFFRFTMGEDQVIPAFEEAVSGMKVGGIRRIIVPSDIGYPENDWRKKDPKPSTFAGKRSLSFVLQNQGLIDKTLLFDIELMKINS